MTTKQRILSALEAGPLTSFSLSLLVDRPQPSVRRTIAALRQNGYDITSTEFGGLYPMYRLNPRVENAANYITDRDFGDEWGL